MGEKAIEAEQNVGIGLDRRRFLAVCSAAGVANTLLPGALLALATRKGVA
jgi:hypothetical protein